jgi:heterocyst glycolipid deposition protein
MMRHGRARSIAVLIVIALAVTALPAAAQQTPPPAAPSAPPGTPSAPPGAPAPAAPPGAPVAPPSIPSVPPVPVAGPGTPLTLVNAVTTALQQNYQVRQAALGVLVARAQVHQAEAQKQVTLGGTAGFTDTSSSNPGQLSGTITIPTSTEGFTNTPFTASIPSLATSPQSWQFGLTFRYPLYSGNALEDQIGIAQANLRVAEAAFTATANQVVLSVRQAYYGVQLGQGQVAAAQRAVDGAQENVRVTDARVRVGTSPRFDLLQAQVLLAQSQQSLTAARTAAIQAQQSLDVVLTLPLTSVASAQTPLGLPAPPQNVEDLVQASLRTRPELAQALASEEAARAAIDLAASGLRPNVTLSAGPSVVTSDPSQRDNVNWSGSIQLTLAILDGGLTQAKVDAARQQLAQAQVTEQQTRQTVELQVRTAYLGLESAAEQLRSAEAALAAAREALRIANLRFQAGVGTQLEVITAEQNLATADVGTIQALYAYNLSLAQLDQAVGVQVKL